MTTTDSNDNWYRVKAVVHELGADVAIDFRISDFENLLRKYGLGEL